ncbi:unnamed protein product [Psylliodes chrysocephalus]|uniref:RNase H type-1 domain-containing protein n=1 Tax=Psylliodes chrysocephalus TaxID=3402493 RepID=A0A9P0GCS4_9CUCU|nr:unnamed protein product [Psylliodes chrysocephala]
MWIPGHSSIRGNDLADSAARNATFGATDEGIPIPLDDVKNYIKNKIYSTWQTKWNTYDGLLRVSKPSIQKWFYPKELTRKEQVELIANNPLQGLAFAPVAEPDHENAIITGRSHERLSNGQFHHVPILIGYNSLEGYLDSIPALFRLWIAKYDLLFSLLVPDDLNARGPITEALLGTRIKTEYFGISPIALSNEKIMRFIADTQFERPIQETIRLYSQKTKVYSYYFAYQGPLWGRVNRTIDAVGHTEDLGYLFDFGYEGSDADYQTRNRMVKLWTNFAKTGNPTPTKEALLQEIVWPANEDVYYYYYYYYYYYTATIELLNHLYNFYRLLLKPSI